MKNNDVVTLQSGVSMLQLSAIKIAGGVANPASDTVLATFKKGGRA